MKWLLLFLAIPAYAQIESVKFHYGDDMRWADPNFDDSGWIDGNTPIDIYSHLLETRSWIRLKVRVPDRTLDPVIGAAISTVEVYVEGRLVGRSGSLPPAFQDAPRAYQVWPIPPEMATPGRVLSVALRLYRYPGFDLRRLDNLAIPKSTLVSFHPAGETPVYERRQSAISRGFAWAAALTLLLLLFLLAVGGAQWTEREFQLLAAYLLLLLAGNLCLVSGWILPWGNRSLAALAFFWAFASVVQLELIADTTGVRPAWWLRAVQGVSLLINLSIVYAGSVVEAPRWLPLVGPAYAGAALLNLVTGIFIVALQKAERAGDRLLPLALAATSSAGLAGQRLLPGLGWTGGFTVGDVLFVPVVIGNIAFALVLAAARIHSLRKAGEVATKLQAQFAAARSVQEMLLAGGTVSTPGYVIDAVYRPAEEVGGDFFRILSAPGDCTLIVVGDVSGKGLRAAMLVSVIVGVLLGRRSSQPHEVLSELNRAIQGQLDGGFVTCCAALLRPGGAVQIANAGHLPAYRNCNEVAMPAGLPLGVILETDYEAIDCPMQPGDKLLFLSDGVAEAQNPQGELFGFERTRAIATKPATVIANAAQTFGQNDDITVVTVRRLA